MTDERREYLLWLELTDRSITLWSIKERINDLEKAIQADINNAIVISSAISMYLKNGMMPPDEWLYIGLVYQNRIRHESRELMDLKHLRASLVL